MSLNTTPQGDRIQIALFGKRNAGKSSVINAMTGQPLAIVSDVKGTTTDPVSKAMEILPLGPCMLIDTPGIDDEGELGSKRVEKAMQVLNKTDIALVVIDITTLTQEILATKRGLPEKELEIIQLIEEKKLPYIIVLNQADRMEDVLSEDIRNRLTAKNPSVPVNVISTTTKKGMEELKDTLIAQAPDADLKLHIIGDLITAGDIVVLVVPVDSAAPKGRLIMPQQQVIRDILDNQAVAVVTQVPELAATLQNLSGKVKMVVTDSQAFKEVSAIVPEDILLTSFSILFARHKGNLKKLVEGVTATDRLKDGDCVLIAEGCTHRRQCDDIGTVKIPRWLKEYTGKELKIETCSGTHFPADLSPYQLVIHCGGCTLHEKEMKHRIFRANEQNVPIVNYGIFIAYVNGILARSVEVFDDVYALISEKKKQ
ncbi:MAG: [FeFe] hydrogenase H-cluster maturation GTPase HydF [Butyribacter sp.]|nr:[FeFe] hydrogenase H-cluster maturation GTPase HydF [bacterium]MDY3854032.1 [FeFe] hydrogenase H-cluster maturation GTPase HydF [Butyribacter sp.]